MSFTMQMSQETPVLPQMKICKITGKLGEFIPRPQTGQYAGRPPMYASMSLYIGDNEICGFVLQGLISEIEQATRGHSAGDEISLWYSPEIVKLPSGVMVQNNNISLPSDRQIEEASFENASATPNDLELQRLMEEQAAEDDAASDYRREYRNMDTLADETEEEFTDDIPF